MGVEYPYLALVSFMLFATMIISLIGAQLWIQYQLLRIPVMEGYAEYREVSVNTSEIVITVRLTRGESVTYQKLIISTDKGVIVANDSSTVTVSPNVTVSVSLEKFSGTLHIGQSGKIIVTITHPEELFTPGKEYGVHVFFDKTMIHCVFMV